MVQGLPAARHCMCKIDVSKSFLCLPRQLEHFVQGHFVLSRYTMDVEPTKIHCCVTKKTIKHSKKNQKTMNSDFLALNQPTLVLCWVDLRVNLFMISLDLGKCSRQQGLYQSDLKIKLIYEFGQFDPSCISDLFRDYHALLDEL